MAVKIAVEPTPSLVSTPQSTRGHTMASVASQQTDLSSTPPGGPVDSVPGTPADCDPPESAPLSDWAPLGDSDLGESAPLCDLAPLCGEQEFTDLLQDMVADYAPGVFAVVQVYGERVDGRIAAWGLTFNDRTEVISLSGRRRMSLQAPENALRFYSTEEHVTARLIWVTLQTTPSDDEDS